MDTVRRWLIKLLGGHCQEEHRRIRQELDQLRGVAEAHEHYKEFAHSIYFYTGQPGYPAWKVQQEFRESQSELGKPVNGSYSKKIRSGTMGKEYIGRGEYIDNYLGIVVDSFAKLVHALPDGVLGIEAHGMKRICQDVEAITT